MSDHLKNIDSKIQYILSYILREIYPDEFLSVTQVNTNRDLSESKILVSVLNDDQLLIDILNAKSSYLRHEISKKLSLRKIPKLSFFMDDSENKYSQIERLLNS